MRRLLSLAFCLVAFPWLGIGPLEKWGMASGDGIVFGALLVSGIGGFLSTLTKTQLAEISLEFLVEVLLEAVSGLAEIVLEAIGYAIGGLVEGCCSNISFNFVLVVGLFSLAGLWLL